MVTAGNRRSLSMRWLEHAPKHARDIRRWTCGPYSVWRLLDGYTVLATGNAHGRSDPEGDYVWHVGCSRTLDGAKKQARKHATEEARAQRKRPRAAKHEQPDCDECICPKCRGARR